jgi:hypothetical protein
MKLTLHPKVASPLVVGALVGLIVTEAGRRGFTIDAGEASNLTMVLMFIAGLFAPRDTSDSAQSSAATEAADKALAEAIAIARSVKEHPAAH